MAKMIDQMPQYYGEAKLWSAIKDFLPDDVVAYNNREINGREFDACLFLPECGILIVEVKGWQADQISVQGVDEINVEGYAKPQRSPKKQARAYRFALLNKIAEKYHVSPLVFDMVCYPFLTQEDYKRTRLDITCEDKFVFFKGDLENAGAFVKKIRTSLDAYRNIPHAAFSAQLMKQLRMEWEPAIHEEQLNPVETARPYSLLSVWHSHISEQDIKQITEQYFSGVKSIIFLHNSDDYRNLVNSFNAGFYHRNIEPSGNSLALGYHDGLKWSDVSCRTFNLEIYYLDQLRELISQDWVSREGAVDNDGKSLLEHLSKLTSFNLQQYLVEHSPVDTNTLVQAGAGTGKTFSMVSRVAFLCNKEENPVTNLEEEIALVTFTNDAANNMQARLKQMFLNYFILTGDSRYLKFVEDLDRSNISTIHKFALSILRGQPLYTGLGTQFKISSDEKARTDDYEDRLNDFLSEMNEENPNFTNELPVPVYDLREKLKELSKRLLDKSVNVENIRAGELGIPEENIFPYFNDLLMKVAFPAEVKYLQNIKDANKIDLNETIILLEKVLDRARRIDNLKLRYLFIDEFQDTDDSQIRVFQKLQKAINQNCKLFVVGDLKQSIYRFRGARLSAFNQLQNSSMFPWSEYYLQINYRTDHELLSSFDRVFSHMGVLSYLPYKEEDRLIGSLSANGAQAGMLEMVPCHGKEENQFDKTFLDVLTGQIKALKDIMAQNNLSREERTIAVLVRNNWQVQRIINTAKKAGISIDTKSGGDLYQLESTLDLYKLVLALEYSTNPVYLVNFIESNYTDLRLNYQKLHGIDSRSRSDYITQILDQFFESKMKKSWRQLVLDAGTKPILYVLKQIFDTLCPWKNYSEKEEEQLFYRENYEYLLECIVKYSRVDSLTITSILRYLKVNIVTKQEHTSRELDDGEQEIRILCITVHKSKGLEYGTVILPFTDDELGDLRRVKLDANYSRSKLSYCVTFENKLREKNTHFIDSSEIGEQISEEARILYVALTRAIRNCVWIKNVDRSPSISWSVMLSQASQEMSAESALSHGE